jgi:predicted transcriptional regulator
MTKQAKLLASFEQGNSLTAKQISSMFGLKDPAASVRNLREQGHCIYANSVKLHDGTESTKYRLGKPTRRMVALAARIAGAGAFTRNV